MARAWKPLRTHAVPGTLPSPTGPRWTHSTSEKQRLAVSSDLQCVATCDGGSTWPALLSDWLPCSVYSHQEHSAVNPFSPLPAALLLTLQVPAEMPLLHNDCLDGVFPSPSPTKPGQNASPNASHCPGIACLVVLLLQATGSGRSGSMSDLCSTASMKPRETLVK